MNEIERIISFWCRNNNLARFGFGRNYGSGTKIADDHENYVLLIMPYRATLEPQEHGVRYSFVLDVCMKPVDDDDQSRRDKLDECLNATAHLVYFLRNLHKVYTANQLYYSEWVTEFPTATLQQPGINIFVQSNNILGHEYARTGSLSTHSVELEVVLPFCYDRMMFDNFVPNPPNPKI